MKTHMIAAAAAALMLLVGGMGKPASAGSWCAYYDQSTRNCGFHSYQQCLDTIRGVGGYCGPNSYGNGRGRW